MEILTRFEFDRDFLMSAVIAKQAGTEDQPELFLKGSPAATAQLIGYDNMPKDWSQVCHALPGCLILPKAPMPTAGWPFYCLLTGSRPVLQGLDPGVLQCLLLPMTPRSVL